MGGAQWRSRGASYLGVNLRALFPEHPVPGPSWYQGKRIAVDGHNMAFRYVTSIRGRDGDLLRGPDGRPIGHLIGFMGLVRRLRMHGAEPIVVWDGPVHPRKRATVDSRIRRRQEALAAAESAQAAGDLEAYARAMRSAAHVDGAMVADATRLLESLGVAVEQAEHDGERHGAGLCRAGHADAVATEDFDALVAGAPVVLRRAGGQEPFLHHLADLDRVGLSPDGLRWVAILCGTDWHPGIRGFGPKTGVAAVREFGDLRRLFREAQQGQEGTRFHRLVRRSGMTWEDFEALDRFIAGVPEPGAPVAPRPCPETAVELAQSWGLGRDRVVSCFC